MVHGLIFATDPDHHVCPIQSFRVHPSPRLAQVAWAPPGEEEGRPAGGSPPDTTGRWKGKGSKEGINCRQEWYVFWFKMSRTAARSWCLELRSEPWCLKCGRCRFHPNLSDSPAPPRTTAVRCCCAGVTPLRSSVRASPCLWRSFIHSEHSSVSI